MLLRISLCLVLCFLVSNCAGPTPPPGKGASQALSPKTSTAPLPRAKPAAHKVALLLPLSGPSKDLGKAMLDAAQMALFNTGNTQIELMPLDTEGSTLAAKTAIEKAISQNAGIILGPVFSKTATSITPYAKSRGLTVISFSNNRSLAGSGIFLFGFTPEDQINHIAAYALQQGITDFYALVPSNSYGTSSLATLREALVNGGGSLNKSELYSDQANLALSIKSISDAIKADPASKKALFIAEGGEPLKTITSLLAQADVTPKNVQFLGSGQWDDPVTLTIPSLQGSWFATASLEAHTLFQQSFKQYYNYTPPRIASIAYDAVALVAALAQNNVPLRPESLISSRGFTGVDGIFRFRANGVSERGLSIVEVTQKGFEVREPSPAEFKTP